MADALPRPPARRRLLVSGLLLGLGTAGAVDEIVFHQLPPSYISRAPSSAPTVPAGGWA